MSEVLEGSITLKKQRCQSLPKKYVITKKILYRTVEYPYTKEKKKYFAVCSFWIPDTPYNPISPPGIVHTIKVGDKYVRLVFEDETALLQFFNDYIDFILQYSNSRKIAYVEALREWIEYQEKIIEFKRKKAPGKAISDDPLSTPYPVQENANKA